MELLLILISPSYGDVYVYKWRVCRGGHGPERGRPNIIIPLHKGRSPLFSVTYLLTKKETGANFRSPLHFEKFERTQLQNVKHCA